MITLSGNTIETTNVNCTTITSDDDSIVVDKPLYQSDIEHDTKVTITAPTINLVGDINRNGSSYTDEILGLISTNNVKRLTRNLTWTVSTAPLSETNFRKLDDALAEAMLYSQSTTYTITINVIETTTRNRSYIIENCDMSHIIITGALPQATTNLPIYEGLRYTLNFKNCICPKISMTLPASEHIDGTCRFIHSKATHVEVMGDNNAVIRAIGSQVNVVGKLASTISRNSTITASNAEIQSLDLSITDSNVYLYECTYTSPVDISGRNINLMITNGSPTLGVLYLNNCNVSIDGANATSLASADITGGRFSIIADTLTTNTTNFVFKLSAGAELSLYLSSYSGSNCTHVSARGSRAYLKGLGTLTGNFLDAIVVADGGIVSLSSTSGTTNVPLNTITADGLVIG